MIPTDGAADTFHVIPVSDLIEHDTSGEPCVCGPDTEAVFRDDGSNGWVVLHHSLDGREIDLPPIPAALLQPFLEINPSPDINPSP